MEKRRIIIILLIFTALVIMAITVVVPMQKNKFDIKNAIDRLHSSDPMVRARSASKLGISDPQAKSAIPYLVKMLDDNTPLEWKVYKGRDLLRVEATTPGREAAKALGKICGPAIDSLINALKSESWSIRENATYGLVNSNDNRVVELLISNLKDDDYDTREIAIITLGKLKNKRAVEPLIAALMNQEYYGNKMKRDYYFKRDLADALGELNDPRAVEPLISILKDDNILTRKSVILALGKIKDKRAVEPLIEALMNPEYYGSKTKYLYLENKRELVHHLILALGELNDPRAIEPLIVLSKDEDYFIRKYVILALAKLKDKRAFEPLIELLKSEYSKADYIKALGELNDPRAVAPIITILLDSNYNYYDDRDRQNREQSIQALEKLTGQKFGQNIIAWQEWWNKNKKK